MDYGGVGAFLGFHSGLVGVCREQAVAGEPIVFKKYTLSAHRPATCARLVRELDARTGFAAVSLIAWTLDFKIEMDKPGRKR